MRLFVGLARDVEVKRTVQVNERRRIGGNLYERTVVLAYAIQSFKAEPVTLTVVEDIVPLFSALFGRPSRPLEWRLGPKTDFPGGPDPERTTLERVTLRTPVPGKGEGGDPPKLERRLHIVFGNVW